MPLILPSSQRRRKTVYFSWNAGFTLVELLVSIAVLVIILALMGSFVNGLTRAVQLGNNQLERMGQAQRAFDLMRRTISEATLHTYYDYVNSSGNFRSGLEGQNSTFVPAGYERASDLRFIAGCAVTGTSLNVVSPYGATVVTHAIFFQAPSGHTNTATDTPLRTLLNTVGFYLEYGNRSDLFPTLRGAPPAGKRFRLMMLIEPTESLTIYTLTTNRAYTGKAWYTNALGTKSNVHLLAENVVAFVVRPEQATGNPASPWSYFTPYPYDTSPLVISLTQPPTQNQLPPVVEITMVALDTANATRLAALGLSALFSDPSETTYTQSLNTITTYLNSKRITYRTFTTDVTVGGAKWSVK